MKCKCDIITEIIRIKLKQNNLLEYGLGKIRWEIIWCLIQKVSNPICYNNTGKQT